MSREVQKKINYSIKHFMTAELSLGGHELLIFAIIYSFTKGSENCFYGSQGYLSSASGLSVSTVARVLEKLVNRGYIEKISYKSRVAYRTLADEGKCVPEDIEAPPNYAGERLPSAAAMERAGVNPHELICETVGRPKYEFIRLGLKDMVSMTAEQYKRLVQLVPPEDVAAYAVKLEMLIEKKGYRSFNHYKTIKKWIYEDCGV